MYEELIKRLTYCRNNAAIVTAEEIVEIADEAIDLIEKLQIVVNFNKFNSKFWEDRYNSLWDIISSLTEANKEEV